MASFEDTVPALDVGASVALAATVEDLRTALKGIEDGERLDIAMAMLDDFVAIDHATGWTRPAVASMLGCEHPDPKAWLKVDIGELAHSQTVVHLIREVADQAAALDLSARRTSLRSLTAAATDDEVQAIAGREASRSAIRLCKDLLRQARGSAFAVKRVLNDGEILRLVAEDLPGDAGLLGKERLLDRSSTTAIIEANLGNIAMVEADPQAPAVTGLEEIHLAIRSAIHPDK